MVPIFVSILVFSTATHAQVYVIAPTGQNYQNQPTKYPNSQNENFHQSNRQIETQLDDPYATIEIFRHSKKVLTADSENPETINVETKPDVHVLSSESQINVHGTPDYFSLYGGNAPLAAEQTEDYSNLFSTNSPISEYKQFSTNSPIQEDFLNPQIGAPVVQDPNDDAQGNPSRYYPIQQNNFAPINDFGPVTFGHNNNAHKLSEITAGTVFPKQMKPKKKYSSKFKKYPKKFKASLKKLNNKVKFNPNREIIDDFSLDSLKNKRRIPSRVNEASEHLTNSFSEDLNSFPSSKGTHSDFTSGSDSSGFSGASDSEGFNGGSGSEGFTDGSGSERYTGGSGSSRYTGSPGGARYTGGSGSAGFTGGSGSGGFTAGSASAGFTAGSGSGGFTGGSGAFHAPHGGDGERMHFQMFGMDGPHSYKFGYDTGKGHNRHFRFEERDNHGKVKGHYGFYDQEGKMSMIHYEADPHTGYKAGPYHHPENHHDFDYNHQNSQDYDS